MSTAITEPWPLAAPPADYVLGHVRAVLPDRLIDDARIVVRGNRIAAVDKHPAGFAADVDGHGLLCVPGLVDIHSDGLENERKPRPDAELPVEFAIRSFEGKLRAAGVTTVFHGLGFEESRGRAIARSVREAERLCDALDAYQGQVIDHRILYRLDVRCPEGLVALERRLDRVPDGAVVSHEDHTPGQGQYADRSYYERYLMERGGISAKQAKAQLDQLMADRDGRLGLREEALSWLGSRSSRIRLLGHDPASAVEIAELRDRGGVGAEFPTTVEAAEAARGCDLHVVIGAPNVLRGGSHSGNVSGRELVGRGFVTALASDYVPSALLAAAMLLVEQQLTSLPTAIGLVTWGPAEAAGLADRGRLQEGFRADLTLVEPRHFWPGVRSVLSCGVL